jgi:hypothetical protein
MARCSSWREIYYDPSSGLLPSQLADPWDPFSLPCSSVTLVDGRLRLSNSNCMTYLGPAGFRRSEPDLLDAPLYLLQMDVNVLSVQPYVDPWSDAVLWFSWVVDGERLGYATLGYQAGQLVASILPDSTQGPIVSMPWDWTIHSHYTYLVERSGDVALEVGNEPPIRAAYDALSLSPDPSVTEVGFHVGGAVADFSYIRVCICEEGASVLDADGDGFSAADGDCSELHADIFPGAAEIPCDGIDQDCDGADLCESVDGRLRLASMSISPAVISPKVVDAAGDALDIRATFEALELPGFPSDKFRFRAIPKVAILYDNTNEKVIDLVGEQMITGLGAQEVRLSWSGRDELAHFAADGRYRVELRVDLVREKLGSGKTQRFGSLSAPPELFDVANASYYQETDIHALVDDSQPDPGGGELPLVVLRSDTGTLKMIYGEDFMVPLASARCHQPTMLARVRCFLEAHKGVLGLSDPYTELTPRYQFPYRTGDTLLAFDQRALGYTVRGADVSLVIDPQDRVRLIYATNTSFLNLPYRRDQLEQIFAAFVPDNHHDAILAAVAPLGITEVDYRVTEEAILVEQGQYLPLGRPAVVIRGAPPGNLFDEFELVLDPTTGEVLETTNLVSSFGQYVYGSALAETESFCAPPTVSCPTGVCHDDFPLPGTDTQRCVIPCTSDEQCALQHGSMWRCFDTPGVPLDGYCYTSRDRDGPNGIMRNFGSYKLVLEDGYHVANQNLQVALDWLNSIIERLVEHHVQDFGLLNGPSVHGKDYKVYLTSTCLVKNGGQLTQMTEYTPCGPAQAFDDAIHLPDWHCGNAWTQPGCPHTSPPFGEFLTHVTPAHEFAHILIGSFIGGAPRPETGLKENLPNMFETLFAVRELPQNTRQDCFRHGRYFSRTAWNDDRTGLHGNCVYYLEQLPYAQRTIFDFFHYDAGSAVGSDDYCSNSTECGPYRNCQGNRCHEIADEHLNGPVWKRFLRILRNGPQDLANDGNDEDIGLQHWTMSAEEHVDLVFQAATQVRPTSSLQDFANLLTNASLASTGHTRPTMGALGAIGFFDHPKRVESAYSEFSQRYTPTIVEFQASLGLGTSKTYRVHVRDSDGALLIDRPGLGGIVYPLLDIVGRPSAVEAFESLYLFWTRRSDGSIHGLEIDRHGDVSLEANLSQLLGGSFHSDGAFGASVLEGELVLVFPEKGTGLLREARCRQHPCVTSDVQVMQDHWREYSPGQHSRQLGGAIPGYFAQPGVAALGAGSVNGSPPYAGPIGQPMDEYLYIAYAARGSGSISLLRMDAQGIIVPSIDARIPSYYPSYRTRDPIGLAVRRSAFPDANGAPMSYLYLAWRDSASSRIFVSVMQNYAGAHGNPWFTRSQHTFRSSRAGTGVGFHEGRHPDEELYLLFTAYQGDRPHTSRLRGRY